MADPLEIRVLGELEIARGGAPLALPQSKKTRALLAYLVLTAAPRRREALCDLLWELPDDPRAALRWSLSKLRPLVNDEDNERIQADRERVGFVPRGASVDMAVAQDARAGGLADIATDRLRGLAALFRGPPLAGLEMPDQLGFEAWRLGQQEMARRLHADIVRTLIGRLDAGSAEAADWLRKLIDIEPQDIELHVLLIECLAASGHKAEAEEQLALSGRVLQAFGDVDMGRLRSAFEPEPARRPAARKAEGGLALQLAVAVDLEQEVRFCTAADGVRIAYATVGEGPPLLKTANWLNNLEFDWESPVWRHVFRSLARDRRLVRYDARGNGLSDWETDNLTFEACVQDLEAVADAAGLERFPLFAISQGCAMAIEYAIRHPDRVSGLILHGGFARGWRIESSPAVIQQGEALMMTMKHSWGRRNPASRQIFTSLFIPEGTPEQFAWFNDLQKITSSPETACALMDMLGRIDIRDRLSEIAVPTLVMHAREDALVPYKFGREMAMGIPGARFVTLESKNHLLLEHEPAWQRFLTEMHRFLETNDGA